MKAKKFKVLLSLVFAMVMLMAPAVASAEEENGASDGINTAEELIAAVNAIEESGSGEIVLTGNFELNEVITVKNKSVSISANDAVTITSATTDVFTVDAGGKLTLGSNVTVNGSSSVLWVINGGEVIIDGASVVSTGDKYPAAALKNSSTMTISSGSVAMNNNANVVTVSVKTGSTLNVNGGAVSSKNSSAIYAKDVNTTVNISAGEVSTQANMSAAYSKEGATINVSGGTLSNPDGSYTLIAAYDGIVNMTGGTVSNGVFAHESAKASATISGTAVVNGGVGTKNDASLTVTGGTFDQDPSAYVSAGYVAQKSGEVWTVAVDDGINTAAELIAAVNAIEESGEIVLTGGFVLDEVITVKNKTVSISANDAVTITSATTDVFTVDAGGKLTLGSNVTVNGSSSVLWVINGGEVIIDGASVVSTGDKYPAAALKNSSTMTISSGSVAMNNNANVVTVSVKTGSTLNVNGGAVSSKNSSAIYAKDVNTTVNISAGEVSTQANMSAAYSKEGATINVSGGTLSNPDGSYTLIAAYDGIVNMTGGTVSNGVFAHESAKASATISGTAVVNGGVGTKNDASLVITGGTFDRDPSAYVDEGYEAVESEGTWTVQVKTEVEEPAVQPEAGNAGEASGSVNESINESTGITTDTVTEALNTNKEANNTVLEGIVKGTEFTVEDTVTNEAAKEALGEDYSEDAAEELKVEVRPYLAVEVSAIDDEQKTMTLDIKALYDVYAVQGENEAKITAASEKTLDVTEKEMKITVPLPAGFVSSTTENVVINHSKNGSVVESIPATVTENEGKYFATFTTTKGFSEFVVALVDVKNTLTLEEKIDFSFVIAKSALASVGDLTATITHGTKNVTIASNAWEALTDNAVEYWRLRYTGVAAKEMGDDITLVITNGANEVLVEETSSVKAYALRCINAQDATDAEKNLMKAVLHYGAKAQTYFGYNTNALVNDGVADAAATYTEVSKTSDIKHNLNLESKLELSFFIEKTGEFADNADMTASINGNTVAWESVTDNGTNYWRLRYSYVWPKQLENDVTLTIAKGNDTVLTDTYSAAAYADKVIAEDDNTALEALMKALRTYGAAAKAYFTQEGV